MRSLPIFQNAIQTILTAMQTIHISTSLPRLNSEIVRENSVFDTKWQRINHIVSGSHNHAYSE